MLNVQCTMFNGQCSMVNEKSRKEETRTPDPHVPNVVRYQLRYFPFHALKAFLGAKATKSGFLENRCKGTKKREKRKEKSKKMHAEAGKTYFSAKFLLICLRSSVFCLTFALANSEEGQKTQNGAIAQLVEQRTENPCVPGSIPGGTTKQTKRACRKDMPPFFLSQPALIPEAPRSYPGNSTLLSRKLHALIPEAPRSYFGSSTLLFRTLHAFISDVFLM